MKIREQLEAEFSRANIDYIANVIGNNKDGFRELMAIVFEKHVHLPQRASWVVEALTVKYPELIFPYIPSIIKKLNNSHHQGVKRDLLRIISRSPLTYKNLGILVDKCFKWAQDSNEEVSIKVHCIQILYNISQMEPELKTEVLSVIEDQIPKNSIGFKTRGSKLIEKLKREINEI